MLAISLIFCQKTKKIILIGDYGTGKSRCVEAVYNSIVAGRKMWPISINLRDHWGAKNAPEIIAGHLASLGISNCIDNVLRLLNNGAITLLLDGVDEVGAQVFGVKQGGRSSIRKIALSGVKDLVQKCPSGVLLTTRAHYFDKDEEIVDALGLPSNENTVIIRCKDEFTEKEAALYMRRIGVDFTPPVWLPKKPLVFQVLALVADKLPSLADGVDSNFTVWRYFISAICEREAYIHKSISPEAVRDVLIELGALSRKQYQRNGRFTLKEIREAYERVISVTPDESGENMLMRLCTLGRVSQESSDRCFVDEYIADGLRAEALIKSIECKKYDYVPWKISLGKVGADILREFIMVNHTEDMCITYLSTYYRQNSQACAEILSVLSEIPGKGINCHDIELHDCEFYRLNIGIRSISNLKIKSSFLSELNLVPELGDFPSLITFEDCQITLLNGISAEKAKPSWLIKCDVTDFNALSNISRIKESNISASCKVLLTVVQRIFFQRGSARKEDALYKSGFEQDYNKHIIKDILNLLRREGIITFAKGKEGTIYKPERAYTHRMRLMMDKLLLSDDPIWKQVSDMKIKK